MRKLITLAAIVALSGCGVEDDLMTERGLPVGVIDAAMSKCNSANSSLDRIYIKSIVYEQIRLPALDADNQPTTVIGYGYNYVVVSRCYSNAKFQISMSFEDIETDHIDSIDQSPTTHNY